MNIIKNSLIKDISFELSEHEIHLWLSFPDHIQDQGLLAKYQQLLSEDEQLRLRRFRFAKHRHTHLVTRAFVRCLLSFYAPLAPQDWRFNKNAYGRPEISPELFTQADVPALRFNLSHTEGVIICAVVLERDIGVDVEDSRRLSADTDIAQRFFSEHEVKCLQSLPKAERRVRFFNYWTLKEAYIKARGMGLSIPLDKFSFHLGDESLGSSPSIGISFAEGFDDQSQDWQFWSWQELPYHFALALKSQAAQTLSFRQFVPLQSIQEREADL